MEQQHFVKVVEDNTLGTRDGWVTGDLEDGELFFIVEQSAATDERVLNEAWSAVAPLVIEQAVRAGIVEWRDPENRKPAEPLRQRSAPEGCTHAGRRVLL